MARARPLAPLLLLPPLLLLAAAAAGAKPPNFLVLFVDGERLQRAEEDSNGGANGRTWGGNGRILAKSKNKSKLRAEKNEKQYRLFYDRNRI